MAKVQRVMHTGGDRDGIIKAGICTIACKPCNNGDWSCSSETCFDNNEHKYRWEMGNGLHADENTMINSRVGIEISLRR